MVEPKELDGKPAWRRVCRAMAYAEALDEEQQAWHQIGLDTLPFNYRWEHIVQVVGLAKALADEVGADLETVEAAAWLHDVRKQEPKHAKAGALAAKDILNATDFSAGKIAAVCVAIGRHEGFYRPEGAPPLEPIEAAVLWDADKLTKLGVQAMMMRWCSAGASGMSLTQRWRDATDFVETVLARTVVSMNTAPGKTMAQERYETMQAMLDLWLREARESGADLQGDS